jgi:hypothetical protein
MPLSIAGAKASPAAFAPFWVICKKIVLQPAANAVKAALG